MEEILDDVSAITHGSKTPSSAAGTSLDSLPFSKSFNFLAKAHMAAENAKARQDLHAEVEAEKAGKAFVARSYHKVYIESPSIVSESRHHPSTSSSIPSSAHGNAYLHEEVEACHRLHSALQLRKKYQPLMEPVLDDTCFPTALTRDMALQGIGMRPVPEDKAHVIESVDGLFVVRSLQPPSLPPPSAAPPSDRKGKKKSQSPSSSSSSSSSAAVISSRGSVHFADATASTASSKEAAFANHTFARKYPLEMFVADLE